MGVRFPTMLGLCLAVLCGLAITFSTPAKENDSARLRNLQGRVQMIDTDSSTITVDTRDGHRRLVVYNQDTKLWFGHSNKGKLSSWDQVRESNYISCAGAMDEKMRLVAKECVHRERK